MIASVPLGLFGGLGKTRADATGQDVFTPAARMIDGFAVAEVGYG